MIFLTRRSCERTRRDKLDGRSVQRYFFTIRGGDRVVEEDAHGTYLPDVAAALSYAEYSVRELRKRGSCNDPTLMMVVEDQARRPVLFVPYFPGF